MGDGDNVEQEMKLTEEFRRTLDVEDPMVPPSYRTNSEDELRLLSIAENFQRQFSHLYPDRKPLFLCPINECGVKKFVSTSIRPTRTGHRQLFWWQGCASFVSNFLRLELLEMPTELPRSLPSSSWVLRTQSASCFGFSSLLLSLLLGSDYHAYCVSGYAVREMCMLDQRTQPCPLLDAEEEQQEDSGGCSPDILQGLRIHSWVLVLSGSRGVQENFFIDPLTGRSHSTTDSSFLAIESLWDNFNYYVNMQDCSNGIQNLVYDLDERSCWEPLLHNVTDRKQLMASVLRRRGGLSIQEEMSSGPRVFQMPRSWISHILISTKDLEQGFPDGQKSIEYRKAKVDHFSPVLRRDRLVQRMTRFRELDCSEVVLVKEWYQNREDCLEERWVDVSNGVTTHRYRHGHRLHLLVQRFNPLTNEHDMEFSSKARVDHLLRRVESPLEMTETYESRPDHLYYRYTQFTAAANGQAHEPAVKAVVERFHRNTSKPAHEDVAQRVFLLVQRRIELTYHLEGDRFIPSKRKFMKPRESTERTKAGDFTQHMVSSFQVDRSKTPLSLLRLYEMLVSLMKDEEKVLAEIRDSKKEVKDILSFRKEEEKNILCDLCPGTEPTEAEGLGLQKAEDVEEQWRLQQVEDILTQFLEGLQTPTQTQELHQRSLCEFTDRMKEQAKLIQDQHQKETQEMQDKEQWYQENQVNLKLQEVLDYHTFQEDKMKTINHIKKRLKLHKLSAAKKYSFLDKKLRTAAPPPHPHPQSTELNTKPSI